MEGEAIQVAGMALVSAGGAGSGAWIAVKIHVSHIRERLANHHKGLDKMQERVTDHDKRLAHLEARQ